jgi:hypothetical protein|tara:strand:- start:307 stop:492 length:186 start_codon:yes stop_codon:yes gene_type:complete
METKLIDDLTHISSNSIKLVKNTKGYNWEIKIYDKEGDDILEEIVRLDNELKMRFSNKGGS